MSENGLIVIWGGNPVRIQVNVTRHLSKYAELEAVEKLDRIKPLLTAFGVNNLASAEFGDPNDDSVYHDTVVWIKAIEESTDAT